MPANSFMTVPGAGRGCARTMATAACSARSAPCPARRSKRPPLYEDAAKDQLVWLVHEPGRRYIGPGLSRWDAAFVGPGVNGRRERWWKCLTTGSLVRAHSSVGRAAD